jgi:hypothetical protein
LIAVHDLSHSVSKPRLAQERKPSGSMNRMLTPLKSSNDIGLKIVPGGW